MCLQRGGEQAGVLCVGQVVGQRDLCVKRVVEALLCGFLVFTCAIEVEEDDLCFGGDAVALDQCCVQCVAG
jgi:hypothetical protein